jgi:hypothetical protein
MSYKEYLGYISLVIAFSSYAPYIRSVLIKQTKPHVFSWIIWGVLTSIGFFAQYSKGAGPGAWATGFVACGCFIVALLAIKEGEKNITKGDTMMFIAALMAIPAWYFTKEPLTAVILITIIDAIGGYYPTLRKSYYNPLEEMMTTYVLGIIQIIISLCALENYSLTTMLYPVFVAFANGGLIVLVLWRRSVIKNHSVG